MKKEKIYMSETYFLEKIYIPTKKKGFVYREVSYKGEELSVKEHDTLPDWYVRELKLQMILDEEN
jgi:hypothetical protein